MFGKPCLKINGKAFACLYENAIAFKLTGDEHKAALSLAGAKLFDPSCRNRPMKEWVQVPAAHSDQWQYFAESAMMYIVENIKL
ncbi:MAG: hypothetical protein NT007_18985 [Candidatus Kapabacteria bacterium]|nr:hypothetical protein [Candidatus Kapabacteria bacterium]